MGKLWTVKEVCDLTGLTGKHLYHFHHNGLVRAVAYKNFSVEDHTGYKLYDEAGVAKLQQIAMYYELGLKRNEIYELMTAPDYDMHRALDELRARLEEKRHRLSVHISAIEQLRLIGTKNGLLDYVSGFSLEELGQNILTLSAHSEEDILTLPSEEEQVVAFEALFAGLEELVQARDPAQQKQIIQKLFRETVQHLRFLGYTFLLGLFLSAAGEGTLSEDLAEDLPVTLLPEHGHLAMEWIREDGNALLSKLASIIAQHHRYIFGPYDTPAIREAVCQVQQVLQEHTGLEGHRLYQVLLPCMPCEEKDPGYLQYLVNALRYHVEHHPELF